MLSRGKGETGKPATPNDQNRNNRNNINHSDASLPPPPGVTQKSLPRKNTLTHENEKKNIQSANNIKPPKASISGKKLYRFRPTAATLTQSQPGHAASPIASPASRKTILSKVTVTDLRTATDLDNDEYGALKSNEAKSTEKIQAMLAHSDAVDNSAEDEFQLYQGLDNKATNTAFTPQNITTVENTILQTLYPEKTAEQANEEIHSRYHAFASNPLQTSVKYDLLFNNPSVTINNIAKLLIAYQIPPEILTENGKTIVKTYNDPLKDAFYNLGCYLRNEPQQCFIAALGARITHEELHNLLNKDITEIAISLKDLNLFHDEFTRYPLHQIHFTLPGKSNITLYSLWAKSIQALPEEGIKNNLEKKLAEIWNAAKIDNNLDNQPTQEYYLSLLLRLSRIESDDVSKAILNEIKSLSILETEPLDLTSALKYSAVKHGKNCSTLNETWSEIIKKIRDTSRREIYQKSLASLLPQFSSKSAPLPRFRSPPFFKSPLSRDIIPPSSRLNNQNILKMTSLSS